MSVDKVDVLLVRQRDVSCKDVSIVCFFKEVTQKQLMKSKSFSAGDALKICNGDIVTDDHGDQYWIESWELLY